MCGGTAYRGLVTKPSKGLSPRVRGNLIASETVGNRIRSIPACAGEPSS